MSGASENDPILARSAAAWDAQADAGDIWSRPVDPEAIARARAGDWSIILTPDKPVPRSWFPQAMTGLRVLGLAASGGQQAPVLAAAGADVTVLDLSAGQLARDREVAEREGLVLRLERGDMADLSRFPDAWFDLVVNPCSVCFAPDVRPVWREAARVLKPGGRLMTGVINPLFYLFDHDRPGEQALVARRALPFFGDGPAYRDAADAAGEAYQFSHTLSDLLGGALDAGLVLTAMYEDSWSEAGIALDALTPLYLAFLFAKPD